MAGTFLAIIICEVVIGTRTFQHIGCSWTISLWLKFTVWMTISSVAVAIAATSFVSAVAVILSTFFGEAGSYHLGVVLPFVFPVLALASPFVVKPPLVLVI